MSKPLLFAFLLANPAFSVPIPASSIQYSSGIQCLAILLAFAGFFSILFVAKHFYIVRRRRHATPSHNNVSFGSSIDSSDQSKSSFFYFPKEKNSKAGFFVGFFGSPNWETTINIPSRGTFRYSLISQIRSSWSVRRTSSQKPSLYEFGERRPISRARTDGSALSSTLCATHPSQSPTYPPRARTSRTRRYSLPATSQTERQTRSQPRTRHSSLKSNRSHRDSSSCSGVRVVSGQTDHDVPLPFPAVSSSFFEFTSTSSIYSSTPRAKRPQSRSDRTPVPPLPPLPFITNSRRSSELPGTFKDTTDGHSHISHPYPLGSRSSSQGATKSERQPDDPTTHIPTGGQVEEDAVPLSSPKHAGTFPRIKPATRTPSLRSKKSPALGPSPLRIVTLPELSISEFGQLSPIVVVPDSDAASTERDPNAHRHLGVYPNIGIGYPSTWTETTRTPEDTSGSPKPRSRPISSFSSHRDSRARQDDSEVMLEIIRDLVEETSQWDQSLHMEDNFKALILSAELTPVGDSDMVQPEPKGSPVEIDLGLLELDAYRMQCLQDAQADARANSSQLATLEEEDEEEEIIVSNRYFGLFRFLP
ncbi:hypothetical protein VNI00_005527 [Paramarasmius palmivorus]|uniref:Uncharacterized protein n=1 Tax=Paramarasmius palmivorus TaxID=297713 RepID=A0AAW0DAX2_9AGAR